MVVERFLDEVVGAGLDRLPLLLSAARRDHDHREHSGFLSRPDPSTDRVPVQLRHHDVEEHEVGIGRLDERERSGAVDGSQDFVAARFQHRLE